MADGDQIPINPRAAFGDIREGLDSRITLLLVIGAMYGIGRASILEDLINSQDDFPVPTFRPGNRLETTSSVLNLQRRHDIDPTEVRSLRDQEPIDRTGFRRRRMADLVNELYEKPRPEIAGEILLLGLGDPNELIRVASAISFLDLFDEISLAVKALLSILEDGLDELAGQLAEITLRKLGATVPIAPPSSPSGSTGTTTNLDTTVLIHGSHFGFVGTPLGDWWKPKGDFHNFIKSAFRQNLYAKPDFFTWSGGFSDHARKLAAIELRDWSYNRQFSSFDVIAHSHGGNVAMWATQLGVSLNNLVLLSCPAHTRHYLPEFVRVRSVVSYQIKLDWVILADGGKTQFGHPQIVDIKLPRWFRRHDDTHSPDIWRRYGLSI